MSAIVSAAAVVFGCRASGNGLVGAEVVGAFVWTVNVVARKFPCYVIGYVFV